MDYFLIAIALALIVLIVVLFVNRSVASKTTKAVPTTGAPMTAAPTAVKAAVPTTTPVTVTPMTGALTTVAPMQAYQGKHDCLRMCGPECQLISDPDPKAQEAKIKTCFSSCQNKCSA